MNKRKQCQAHVDTTNSRCSKSALRGTRYCWWHQSKGLFILSLLAGSVLSLTFSEIWRRIVPTTEQKELRLARSEISDLQQDIQQVKRKPEFQPFVNGVAVTDFTDIKFPTSLGVRTVRQASIVIPTTNNRQRLQLSIRNIGNVPADKLTVYVRLPSGLNFNTGSAWKPIAFITRAEKGVLPDPGTSYYIDSAHIIDPGAYFSCDSIVIESEVTKPLIVPLNVELSSLQAEKNRFNLVIVFVPGTGEPFVNKLRE